MCGAITMVDKIAVIDQLSCMSCHECVDVCDWNALQWTTVQDNSEPKRIKKGVEIHPQPDWQVLTFTPNKADAQAATYKPHSWARMVNAFILLSVLSVVIVGSFVL
jgi:Fe-S-cluster-containing hydrogenase component 2